MFSSHISVKSKATVDLQCLCDVLYCCWHSYCCGVLWKEWRRLRTRYLTVKHGNGP